jgi:hypothetical protein
MAFTPLTATGSVPTPPNFQPLPQQATGSTLPRPYPWSLNVTWGTPRPPPSSPFGGLDMPLATVPTVYTPPPSRATLNAPFSFTFGAWGGMPPYTFASTGTLPTGITLTSAGVLAGTPTAAGTSTFTVTPSAGGVTGTPFSVTLTVA